MSDNPPIEKVKVKKLDPDSKVREIKHQTIKKILWMLIGLIGITIIALTIIFIASNHRLSTIQSINAAPGDLLTSDKMVEIYKTLKSLQISQFQTLAAILLTPIVTGFFTILGIYIRKDD